MAQFRQPDAGYNHKKARHKSFESVRVKNQYCISEDTTSTAITEIAHLSSIQKY
jgi:hypothetical protein